MKKPGSCRGRCLGMISGLREQNSLLMIHLVFPLLYSLSSVEGTTCPSLTLVGLANSFSLEALMQLTSSVMNISKKPLTCKSVGRGQHNPNYQSRIRSASISGGSQLRFGKEFFIDKLLCKESKAFLRQRSSQSQQRPAIQRRKSSQKFFRRHGSSAIKGSEIFRKVLPARLILPLVGRTSPEMETSRTTADADGEGIGITAIARAGKRSWKTAAVCKP